MKALYRLLYSHPRHQHSLSPACQFRRIALALVLTLCLHSFAMMLFESLTIDEAIWLTLTTAATVGYGDLAPQTAMGRLSTVLLLYGVGIAAMAKLAALYFEHSARRHHLMITGQWSWNVKDHIVILNAPSTRPEVYFQQLITQIRASATNLSDCPVVIVDSVFQSGLPPSLQSLPEVTHVARTASTQEALLSANVKQAKAVVVLSRNEYRPDSDHLNFSLVHTLRMMGVKARIISENLMDENRARLLDIGADQVIRPVRSYPEILARAILAPGAEQVLEMLLNSAHEECVRYEADFQGIWKCILYKLVGDNVGLPVGYEDRKGQIITNPPLEKEVSLRAIFVVIHQKTPPSDKDVKQICLTAQQEHSYGE